MEGRTNVRDKPRPGRPTEAVTPTMVVNLEVFVKKEHRVTLQEVVNQFSTGKKPANQILQEKLGMSKVQARLVPKTSNRKPKSIQGDHSSRIFRVF